MDSKLKTTFEFGLNFHQTKWYILLHMVIFIDKILLKFGPQNTRSTYQSYLTL